MIFKNRMFRWVCLISCSILEGIGLKMSLILQEHTKIQESLSHLDKGPKNIKKGSRTVRILNQSMLKMIKNLVI